MSTPASATPATLLASMLVGSVVSMVPKYAVTIWYCGNGVFGSAGLGTDGVCTKAAARKVCFPHAAAAIAVASNAYLMGGFPSSRKLYRRAACGQELHRPQIA